ncbi:Uncharacterized protein APZ42_001765 [Daphnia magna]|uniref:Uncharacterized protein n=1 Tax=Daphnia magna TaxID=35525 RepID=A0A0P5AHY5_9CRUS|nr:Uncharacterized protein APZ42_001765 [Daphnia magna]
MFQNLLILISWLLGNQPEFILPLYYSADERDDMERRARQQNGTSQPPDTGHHQPPDERTNDNNDEVGLSTQNWTKSLKAILVFSFLVVVLVILYKTGISLLEHFVPPANCVLPMTSKL